MLDVAPTELLLVAVVALVVIGPKDLPKAMRVVGRWVGRARGMARHFRSGIDTMIREAELEELEKKWKEENERIMRAHPAPFAEGPEPAAPALTPPPAEPMPAAGPIVSTEPAEPMLPLAPPAPSETPPAAVDERREQP